MPGDDGFDLAVCYVRDGGAKAQLGGKNFPTDKLLKFYALFKQATIGECNIPKPSVFSIEASAKWKAWDSLGDMSQASARSCYLSLLSSVAPDWRSWEGLPAAPQSPASAAGPAPTPAPAGGDDEPDVMGDAAPETPSRRRTEPAADNAPASRGPAHFPETPAPRASSLIALITYAFGVQIIILTALFATLLRSAMADQGLALPSTNPSQWGYKWEEVLSVDAQMIRSLGAALRSSPSLSLSLSALLFAIVSHSCLTLAASSEWALLSASLSRSHRRYAAVAQELLEARVGGGASASLQGSHRLVSPVRGGTPSQARQTPFTPATTPGGSVSGGVTLSGWGTDGFVFSSPGGPDLVLKLKQSSTPGRRA